jgi:alkanesulfonate monooxygenase SsuD/methylene tetrahydromethanopterin reductase-like flavin-dependent oxidoreductase (luciferase family)
MWAHPRDRSTEYNTIQYWQDLARLAERGKFDGIFLADIVGRLAPGRSDCMSTTR